MPNEHSPRAKHFAAPRFRPSITFYRYNLSPKFLRSLLMSLSREDRKSLCVQLTNPKGIHQMIMKYDVPPSEGVSLKDQQLNLESLISPVSCR